MNEREEFATKVIVWCIILTFLTFLFGLLAGLTDGIKIVSH